MKMGTTAIVLLAALAQSACTRDTELDFAPHGIIDRGEANAGAGLFASLLYDEEARPHVAYYHADLGELRHARWTGAAWLVETVDGAGETQDRGRQSQMVRTPDGTLYIAYQDSVSNSVLLATHRDGAWAREVVDDGPFHLGSFLALGISAGQPVVAYYDQSNGDLMLARREKAGEWTRALVAEDGDVGRYVSMDVDAAGKVHLAYYNASQGGLHYASLVTEQIVIEQVAGFAPPAADEDDSPADPGDVGTWTRILVQPIDRNATTPVTPKILYHDRARNILRLAERAEDGRWTHSIVDDAGYVGTDNDFVWSADGDLTAVYLDGTNLDLKVARRTGRTGAWAHQTLLSEGAVGLYNSLALAPAAAGDGRHFGVASYDLSRGRLVYLFLPVRP